MALWYRLQPSSAYSIGPSSYQPDICPLFSHGSFPKLNKVWTILARLVQPSFIAIQSRNISIDNNGTTKLCDFGLVQVFHEARKEMALRTSYWYDLRYMFHELALRYALGCIGLEFAYLQRPSSGHNCISKVLHDICHDIPPAIRPARAEEHPGHLVLWNLLETCWTSEPNDRLTSRDIFGHLSSAGNAIIEALEDVPVP
ncbi:hypothetical protein FRC15_000323 [Serendipita sp. 397]|nr:hypothetical protein FRC15_000323 [Serendipita sp. 397]KAG8791788.1 hypothetical protein FRC16_000287 [Serendipita sp. 398]